MTRYSSTRRLFAAGLAVAAGLGTRAAGGAGRAISSYERISVSRTGGDAHGDSGAPAVSGDGRYVAFVSFAPDLVGNDLNGLPDVFVRDRERGVTVRVSVSTAGVEGNGVSGLDVNGLPVPPGISSNGRFVVFASNANNLAPGDSNGVKDVFIRDRDRDGNGVYDEVGTGKTATERVSLSNLNDPVLGFQGDDNSSNPAVSGDGRYVAFQSDAHNLVDLNGDQVADDNDPDHSDMFVRDRQAARTRMLSLDANGVQGQGANESPSMSEDGLTVLFLSRANLFHADESVDDIVIRSPAGIERRNVATDGTPANFASGTAVLSRDGKAAAFSSVGSNLVTGDTNGFFDIFKNFPYPSSPTRLKTVRVSVSNSNVQGNGDSFSPTTNYDGQYVAFASAATNLVSQTNGPNIFVHDVDSHHTARVGTTTNGLRANGASDFPAISNDGQYLAIQSSASNLAPDGNNLDDVFVARNPFAFRITGRITSGGTLPAGLTVTALRSSNGRTRTVPVAADGTYAIGGLNAGTYTVTPAGRGTTFTPANRSVSIATADINGVDFAAGGGTTGFGISGTITSGGAGLGAVTVTAGGRSATTAPNGTYTITGLPAGSYTVTPSKTGFAFTPASRAVTISSTSVTGISFTAVRTYTISGTITLGGAGLSGVSVTAGGKSALTGSTGAYTLPGLPAGTYTVTPSKTGFGFTPVSRSVTLSSANVTGINFTAFRVFNISGTVFSGGQGLAGVTVKAGTRTATTGSGGGYTLVGLANGTYTVSPTKSGFVFTPTSRSVTINNANVTGINFTGAPTFNISGVIRTASGASIGGITVRAGTRSAVTSSNGGYTITGLVAGTYSVTPSRSGYVFSPTSKSVQVGPSKTGINFTGAAT